MMKKFLPFILIGGFIVVVVLIVSYLVTDVTSSLKSLTDSLPTWLGGGNNNSNGTSASSSNAGDYTTAPYSIWSPSTWFGSGGY